MSAFGWLDTCEEDRRRALEVIEAFTLRGTRDELGISRIRDTLSHALCPGLTTVQTRAAYFLFVPWIYQELDEGGYTAAQRSRWGREQELLLRDELMASGERDGVIGVQAGSRLQRLPSATYWSGLEELGIHLSAAAAARRRLESDGSGPPSRWDPHLPEPPDYFPEGATLALRPQDAAYLRDRFHQDTPHSLVTWLIGREEAVPEVPFAWEHPRRADLPPLLANVVDHAEAFSLRMQGAAFLYNQMLAEVAGKEDLRQTYEEALDTWWDELAQHEQLHAAWDRPAFWRLVLERNARIGTATRHFCERWFGLLDRSASAAALRQDRDARELIQRQERRLKGRRARLESLPHLELWNGAAGTSRLGFRWGIARAVANDVIDGLRQEG